jgi:hypothetical protein
MVKEGHEPFLHVLDTPLREHVKRFSECTKLSRLLGFCQMPGQPAPPITITRIRIM